MIEISTYCQPTPWNDRLVSLLSAVLLNPIRPDFTRAIDHKPSILPAHRQNLPVVGVVVLLPPSQKSESRLWRACRRLRRRMRKHVIRYSLQVTFVNNNNNNNNKEDSSVTQENFAQTLNDIAKVTDRYVLLSLDGDPSTLKSVLKYQGNQGLRLLGCVLLQPAVGFDIEYDMMMNSYCHVPILLLSPVANQHFIQLANNTNPLLLLAFLSNNHSLGHWFDDEMVSVWLGRTIAKYVEAIALMVANEESKVEMPQRSKL